ncbi:MAG: chitobiase/beta-hexosaminidase C-terminal domain-containing protein, partial [Bacteroidales bacterium]
MKKINVLGAIFTVLILLFGAHYSGFSQIICNGSFETWTNDNTPTCWKGSKTNLAAANIVKYSAAAEEGLYSCQLINATTSHKRFSSQAISVTQGQAYTISFWMRGSGQIRTALYDGRTASSGYSNYTPYDTINTTTFINRVDTIVADNTTSVAELIFSVVNTSATNDHIQIDNVVVEVYPPVSSDQVSTPSFSPASGNYFTTFNATITCGTENASIYYTLDGTTPTNTSTLYTAPVNITSTTTVNAIAYASGLNPSEVSTVTYTFPAVTEVATIAAFKAANSATNSTPYKITGDLTYVFKNGSNLYVQDTTGGLLIFNSGNIISTQYNEGDIISGGIIGTYELYNGLVEFKPLVNTPAASSNVGTVTPSTVTMADILSNYSLYESKLVTLSDVFFADNITFSTSAATNVDILQNNQTMICRNSFKTLTLSIDSNYNAVVTGFVAKFNSDYQIFPRGNADITAYVSTTPSISIVNPEENEQFMSTDSFRVVMAVENFEIGIDGLIKLESSILTGMGLPNPIYLNVADMAYLSTLYIRLPAGSYSATASLVAMDSTELQPAVNVIRNFSVINPTLPAPIFTPAGGTYYETQNVTMSCLNSDAVIYYTIDNSDPTTASTVYSQPIEVSSNVTVKAMAVLANFNNSEIASATYQIVRTPVLSTNINNVEFAYGDTSKTFTVTGHYLDSSITLICNNADFVVSPLTLPANATESLVTVTYTGTALSNTGMITITSDTISVEVALNVNIVLPPLEDTIIAYTGFEASEGFVATTVYNNPTVVYTGATGHQWGTVYGTPTASNPVQSMQMRWYTSTPQNVGYTFTDFDVNNATKVQFYASNSNGLNVSVSYSTDGGTTFIGDSVIALTSTKEFYTYLISDSGQYNTVRLKFSISLPATLPTATSRVVIDSVVFFGIVGLEPTAVSTPVITPISGTYYEPQLVTMTCATDGAIIRYTTDGTIPTNTATEYTQSFSVSSNSVIKAKAFKAGLTESNVAVSTISFPTEVANIAAFKAANTATNTTPYKITGAVTFVYSSGANIYVQDTTGGLLIFNNGTITNTYTEGDVITGGVTGTYTLYNEMVELTPLRNLDTATGNTGTVVPVEVTIEELLTNYSTYESRLVTIHDVIFAAGTFNTTSATNIEFSQNGDTMICRNIHKTLNMSIEDSTLANVTGFVHRFQSTVQLAPRTNSDIEEIVLQQVATPTFNPAGGVYETVFDLTIHCATENATIYYTVDGSEP